MNFKRFFTCIVSFVLLLGCLSASSCGYYHMGSMMHPQIKSIAFNEIRNDTKEPLLTSVVRAQLAAQFQSDNSLKLESKSKADCILYCRIVSAETHTVRTSSVDGDKTFRPSELCATITVEFTVLIPGKAEPLLPLRTVSGSANYQYDSDPNRSKYYGMKQAAYNLANLIVQYTTEAW